VASHSERLAEVRAALLELEACVAKYRGVRVPRRASPAVGLGLANGGGAVGGASSSGGGGGGGGGGEAGRPAGARRRILPASIRALVAWWRRSRAKQQIGTSGPSLP
jgi:hypothetical protein